MNQFIRKFSWLILRLIPVVHLNLISCVSVDDVCSFGLFFCFVLIDFPRFVFTCQIVAYKIYEWIGHQTLNPNEDWCVWTRVIFFFHSFALFIYLCGIEIERKATIGKLKTKKNSTYIGNEKNPKPVLHRTRARFYTTVYHHSSKQTHTYINIIFNVNAYVRHHITHFGEQKKPFNGMEYISIHFLLPFSLSLWMMVFVRWIQQQRSINHNVYYKVPLSYDWHKFLFRFCFVFFFFFFLFHFQHWSTTQWVYCVRWSLKCLFLLRQREKQDD